MSTIFILGTSVAGVKAAQELKRKRPEDTIVLYSLDGSRPINRDGIADVLAKNKKLSDIEYSADGLTIETEQKISKVNLNRKRLYLETKEQIPFDQIVVADTGSWRFPDIKGTHKSGCFYLKTRRDIEKVLDQILLSEDIIIQSESIEGLLYALAITRRERNVVLIYTGRTLLPGVTEKETEEAFIQFCEQRGLKIHPRVNVQEILGDSDLKAVRLSSGKVIAAQCVLFTEVRFDTRIFSEAPELRHGLLDINEKYLTTKADAYAVGDAINLKYLSTEELEGQGECLARAMAGESSVELTQKAQIGFKTEGIHYAQFGSFAADEGASEQVYVQKEPFIYKKFLIQHNCLKGAVLVNAPEDETKVQALYAEKTPIEGQLEQFALPELATTNDT